MSNANAPPPQPINIFREEPEITQEDFDNAIPEVKELARVWLQMESSQFNRVSWQYIKDNSSDSLRAMIEKAEKQRAFKTNQPFAKIFGKRSYNLRVFIAYRNHIRREREQERERRPERMGLAPAAEVSHDDADPDEEVPGLNVEEEQNNNAAAGDGNPEEEEEENADPAEDADSPAAAAPGSAAAKSPAAAAAKPEDAAAAAAKEAPIAVKSPPIAAKSPPIAAKNPPVAAAKSPAAAATAESPYFAAKGAPAAAGKSPPRPLGGLGRGPGYYSGPGFYVGPGFYGGEESQQQPKKPVPHKRVGIKAPPKSAPYKPGNSDVESEKEEEEDEPEATVDTKTRAKPRKARAAKSGRKAAPRKETPKKAKASKAKSATKRTAKSIKKESAVAAAPPNDDEDASDEESVCAIYKFNAHSLYPEIDDAHKELAWWIAYSRKWPKPGRKKPDGKFGFIHVFYWAFTTKAASDGVKRILAPRNGKGKAWTDGLLKLSPRDFAPEGLEDEFVAFVEAVEAELKERDAAEAAEVEAKEEASLTSDEESPAVAEDEKSDDGAKKPAAKPDAAEGVAQDAEDPVVRDERLPLEGAVARPVAAAALQINGRARREPPPARMPFNADGTPDFTQLRAAQRQLAELMVESERRNGGRTDWNYVQGNATSFLAELLAFKKNKTRNFPGDWRRCVPEELDELFLAYKKSLEEGHALVPQVAVPPPSTRQRIQPPEHVIIREQGASSPFQYFDYSPEDDVMPASARRNDEDPPAVAAVAASSRRRPAEEETDDARQEPARKRARRGQADTEAEPTNADVQMDQGDEPQAAAAQPAVAVRQAQNAFENAAAGTDDEADDEVAQAHEDASSDDASDAADQAAIQALLQRPIAIDSDDEVPHSELAVRILDAYNRSHRSLETRRENFERQMAQDRQAENLRREQFEQEQAQRRADFEEEQAALISQLEQDYPMIRTRIRGLVDGHRGP